MFDIFQRGIYDIIIQWDRLQYIINLSLTVKCIICALIVRRVSLKLIY
ncbi:hypothetical protein Avbf_17986, partial [Armadillidium vulgare]